MGEIGEQPHKSLKYLHGKTGPLMEYWRRISKILELKAKFPRQV
jgi:hypothetical protein